MMLLQNPTASSSCSISIMILVIFLTISALLYCTNTTTSLVWNKQPSNQHSDQYRTTKSSSSQQHKLASSDTVYDVAVLGAGPAGLTAALFAARSGLSVVVFGSQSGLLSETPRLENFPSYDESSSSSSSSGTANTGIDWLSTTRKQAEHVGAQFAQPGLLVTTLLPSDKNFTLVSQLDTAYTSLSVIIATGATPRRLGLSKEEELWGISIHNCAICDGSLYDDKIVLIVGGGDAALDAAVYVSRRAKQVWLIHRRREFTAKQSIKLVTENDNIKILTPYKVIEWETNSQQELIGAQIKHTETGKTQMLPCDGVFLMIGATPNTKYFDGILDLENDGLIRLENSNKMCTKQTSLPGVFAAGEVTDNLYRQAITASAEGAQAALDAERWLRQMQKTVKTKDPNLIQSMPSKRIQAPKKISPPIQREERDSNLDANSQAGDGLRQRNRNVDCDFGKEWCMTETINQYPLVVFSSYTCPQCRRLLELLAIIGIKETHVIELGAHWDIPQDVRYQLTVHAGSRSVPSLFIGGKSIGGYYEAKQLQISGELSVKLKESGIVVVNHR